MTKNIFYSKNQLIRAPELYFDQNWIEDSLTKRSTRVVPVWQNLNLIVETDPPKAVTFSGDHARRLIELSGEIALLGIKKIYESDEEAHAYFVVDVSNHELPNITPFMGEAKFIDLREVGVLMDNHESSMLAHARGIMFWHKNNQFCSACGFRSASKQGGRIRLCSNPDCEREHFPRTDPAVIMLVTRPGPAGGSCLLGRSHHFRKGMYSSLAGFVDQGETLEQAVAREVFEETGITIGNIKYRASQPWPFPASLMLGFRAEATSTKININTKEIEDARWFPKSIVANNNNSKLKLPREDSIASWLIKDWLNDN